MPVVINSADMCDDQFPLISSIGRGPRGEKGDDGSQGFSPIVSITDIIHDGVVTGHDIVMTDTYGDHEYVVSTYAGEEAVRDSNESARIAAELQRQQDTSSAIASANAATAATQAAIANAEAATDATRAAIADAEAAAGDTRAAIAAAEAATTSAQSATLAATAATEAAQTATTAAQAATTAAETATGEAEDATEAANAAAETATTAAEHITDGHFPALTSGAALSLTSPTAAESTWAQRVTDAVDGMAVVDRILGKTVVWNQIVRRERRTSTTNGITATMNTDGSATITGTATQSGTSVLQSPVAIVANHKYLIRGGVAGGSFATYYLNVSGIGPDYGNGNIFSYESDLEGKLRYTYRAGDTFNNVTFYPQLFDLTRMFGAGNEPSTVAEFEALFPEPYYPYDEGSLLSVNLTGVESADANGNVLQQRTIPAATYFPNGMRSAGTVHDELTSDAAIVRVGAVDLGTLSWVANTDSTGQYFRALLNEAKNTASTGAIANVLCARYTAASMSNVYDGAVALSTSASNTYVYIRDTAYSTKEAFKAAMDGVTLFFELKTPTTTPIDPPMTMTYRVEQGGTESVMHTDPTAAPTWRIRYPLDLAGTVMANIAPVEQPVATANHAVGDLLCVGWQLYRVISAIAIGEAITTGINVTPTTVAAELAAIQ